MKSISPEMAAHIAQETTTLCTCWKTTLRDGAIYGFTDNVTDLLIDGITYRASTGYNATAIDTDAGLTVDNLDALGVLDPTAFSDVDVRAGRWDFAAVEIFQVNYKDLSMGTIPLRSGTLGEVTLGKTMFTAELRGMGQPLSQTIGRLHLPACDADLGDARCKVNLDTFPDGKVTASVSIVQSRRSFSGVTLNQATGWFDGGSVTFTTGANIWAPREVKTFTTGGALVMQEAFPFDIVPGESFTITAGCDKIFTTCINKFSNEANFMGFPHMPLNDRLISGT